VGTPRSALCRSVDRPPATALSTLSLHDALPILSPAGSADQVFQLERLEEIPGQRGGERWTPGQRRGVDRNVLHEPPELLELTVQIGRHTSELQSRFDLVCRLLLEKKKKHGIRAA